MSWAPSPTNKGQYIPPINPNSFCNKQRQLQPQLPLILLFSSLCFFLESELGVEDLLAKAKGLGSDLDKLVLSDKLNSLLKAHYLMRYKTEGLVSS